MYPQQRPPVDPIAGELIPRVPDRDVLDAPLLNPLARPSTRPELVAAILLTVAVLAAFVVAVASLVA